MKVAINIAMVAALIIAAPYLGLFVTTGVYLAAHMTLLGVRPLGLTLAVAAGVTLVLYCFFGLLLGVEMRGALLV